MACGELPELREARLKVKALRSFVRQVDVALARAEDALEDNKCKCQSTPQPLEAQGHDHRKPHLTAA